MICLPCHHGLHALCPELARQDDGTLTGTERAASSLCDCQHEPREKP